MSELIKYNKTDDLVRDAVRIVDASRQNAQRAVNTALVQRNWLLGKRIAEETLGSQSRDERYGNQVVQNLANELTERYGKGFDFSSLYKYVRFYQGYPNILETVSPKSFMLSWSHYLTLLQVDDPVACRRRGRQPLRPDC